LHIIATACSVFALLCATTHVAVTSAATFAATRPPSPTVAHSTSLRIVELSTTVDAAQLRELARALTSSTAVRPVVVVAPASAWLSAPPDQALIELLLRASSADGAAIVITPTASAPPGAFNATALLYALISDRFATGRIDLAPGSDLAAWDELEHHALAWTTLSGRFARGQSVAASQLRAQRVSSPAELAAALNAGSSHDVLWARFASSRSEGFNALFLQPGRPQLHEPPRPRPADDGVPVALVAALIAGAMIAAGGVLLRRRAVRHPPRRRHLPPRLSQQAQDSSHAPSGPTKPAVDPQRWANPGCVPAIIRPGSSPDARVRTALCPDGYVEIHNCLLRATWAGSQTPPQLGETVTAQIVDGALTALPHARTFPASSTDQDRSR